MKIETIMKFPVVSVGLDDPLKIVEEIFEGSDIRHVLVTDGDCLVGMISESDVLKVISPYVHTHVHTTRDLATLNQRVHQVVRRHPKYLTPMDNVGDAVRLFLSDRLICIPVVDEGMRPVGVVTHTDVFRALDALGVTDMLDEMAS
jgi:acetoin utilization protein AcuB